MKYDRTGDYDLKTIADYEGVQIAEVLACVPGAADGESWHYIVKLANGGFAYLTGWCDYTGWGCRDGSNKVLTTTALKAAKFATKPDLDIQKQLIDQLKGRQPYGVRLVSYKGGSKA